MSYRKIKIYISASLQDRGVVQQFKNNIDDAHKGKYEITCRWWDEDDDDPITRALECKIGVAECDLFIMYNGTKKTTGKSIELGMAILAGKPTLIYGEPLTTSFRAVVKYCGNKLPESLNDQ